MPARNNPVTDDTLHPAVTGARSLTAHEAADLLEISPVTLRAWEQEFGFPAPMTSKHPGPNYLLTELLVL